MFLTSCATVLSAFAATCFVICIATLQYRDGPLVQGRKLRLREGNQIKVINLERDKVGF